MREGAAAPRVFRDLRKSQDEYCEYYREHLGWAVYVLAPGVA